MVSGLAGDHADIATDQMLDIDGGLMTGYGEDLRAIVRKRMADMKAVREDKK